MKLHEHQAKALLADYGLPLPPGRLANSADTAAAAARDLLAGDCQRVAIKAQILAGARGEAGGVLFAETGEAAALAARGLIGRRLKTAQTGAEGRAVETVYVEAAVEVERELYLAALVDRSLGRLILLASAEGGAEIEQRAAEHPDSIRRLTVPLTGGGLNREDAMTLAEAIGLGGSLVGEAAKIMALLVKAFVENDAELIEVNPLAVTAGKRLVALDVKLSIDDNALFRHPKLAGLRERERDPTELAAAQHELNYVRLDGTVGCLVNGAGLMMATLDLLANAGGQAADFMDIRPMASRGEIAAAYRLLRDNPHVKSILVNVYGGGILRCDTIAEGIALAVREGGRQIPLTVRAAGTNAELARQVLMSQGAKATFVDDMAEAARIAVAAA